MNWKNIPAVVRFWFLNLLLFLGVGFLNRLILVIFSEQSFKGTPFSLLNQSFLVGVRFDLAVFGYAMILPILILGVNYTHRGFFSIHRSWVIYIYTFLILSVAANVLDIFHWPYFEARLGTALFQWFESAETAFKITYESYPFVRATLGFLIYIGIIWYLIKKIVLYSQGGQTHFNWPWRVSLAVVLVVLTALSARGRVASKSPLRVGHAYFSGDIYANNLALNSLFTFLYSLHHDLRSQLKPSVSKEKFATYLQKYQEFIKKDGSKIDSSVSMEPTRLNFVVVLMESFSAKYSSRLHPELRSYNLTPHFDRLMDQGRIYSSFFSNANHTGHGVFNTSTGIPNPLGISMTKRNEGVKNFGSYSEQLRRRGYHTVFMTTHDAHFDNMFGFMRANGYEQIIGDAEYSIPPISSMGVADHVMFDHAVNLMSELSSQDKPFVITMLTGSNHGPYVVPEIDFKKFVGEDELGKSHQVVFNAVRYADFALGRFIDESRKKDYFKNTVFFFVADHGATIGKSSLPINISRFIVPLLIIDGSGKYIKAKEEKTFSASQMDIAPTVMDLAGGKYEDNFLGTSLLRHEKDRLVPFFFQDTVALVYGKEWYIEHSYTQSKAYNWSNGEELASSQLPYAEAIEFSKTLLSWALYTPTVLSKK